MKTYKSFYEHLVAADNVDDNVITDDDDDELLQSLLDEAYGTGLEESLGSVVAGVSIALVVKNRSFLQKLKSATDVGDKLDALGKMIMINTYGCLAAASASAKNLGTLKKMKGFSRGK
jgi:hypothetical protein